MSFLTDNPVSSWTFLQEPLWRWFIMFGAALAISIVWRGVIDFIKQREEIALRYFVALMIVYALARGRFNDYKSFATGA